MENMTDLACERARLLPYLSAQRGDVPLESSVHSVEGLGFAEVLAHVLRELLQLLLDLSHQLLPVVKVPGRERDRERTNRRSSVSWFNVLINCSLLPLSGITSAGLRRCTASFRHIDGFSSHFSSS